VWRMLSLEARLSKLKAKRKAAQKKGLVFLLSANTGWIVAVNRCAGYTMPLRGCIESKVGTRASYC
jgi:hypothetical protein